MNNNPDANPKIDEARWDAWVARGRAHDVAVGRRVRPALWGILMVLIAWIYYTLSY